MNESCGRFLGVIGFVLALTASAVGFQEDPVYQVGDPGVTAPRVVKEVRPQYSRQAMEAKVQGEVVLSAIVNQKGAPTDIRVVKSLEASLDREAVAALRKWVFEPGRRNGDPVRVEVEMQLVFKIF